MLAPGQWARQPPAVLRRGGLCAMPENFPRSLRRKPNPAELCGLRQRCCWPKECLPPLPSMLRGRPHTTPSAPWASRAAAAASATLFRLFSSICGVTGVTISSEASHTASPVRRSPYSTAIHFIGVPHVLCSVTIIPCAGSGCNKARQVGSKKAHPLISKGCAENMGEDKLRSSACACPAGWSAGWPGQS